MPPAARIGDMHTCPMATPGTPPVPHVGGPISLGAATVMIGMMPAARVGDMAICVGPPDTIAKGSPTVLIEYMMAARMGDLTMHGGVITAGCPTVIIGEFGMGGAVTAVGAPPPTPLERAKKLIVTKGTADQADADLVAAELAKLPPGALKKMEDQGTKVVVCRGSVTEYLTDLKGVQPRGWPPGMTWDSVPGLNSPSTNEVVIATVGHGTPAGAHVPATGEGHGSQNLVIHESMHSVDLNGKGIPQSSSTDFTKARDADKSTLGVYESQPGNAGPEETYAESAARYYGGDSKDAKVHPNLNKYWGTDPLK